MSETTLGEILAKLRKDRGFSQQELAEASNLPAASISYYENDQRLPSLNGIARLLDNLNGQIVIEYQDRRWEIHPEGGDGETPEIEPVEGDGGLLGGLNDQERRDIIEFIESRRRHSGD